MATSIPTRRGTPVPFTHVHITDAFWQPRVTANRERTLATEYRQCQDTGRIDAFALGWKSGMPHEPHIFWDSDVAKWIEAASYSLASHPDADLAKTLEDVVALVVSAQGPDGYLNTHYTVVEPEKRWSNLRDCHELYCAGHLMEAAVAHYQSTGSRVLLDCLCRYADYIGTVFGTEPGQQRGYCGHEEIELALVKLYHATGEERYLRLSRYFVDERGQQPHFFVLEAVARGEKPANFWPKEGHAYAQAHLPVREQREVIGHAVRAMYLYCAMADLAGELGDADLLAACRRLWDDLTLRKMYLTGGIGPSKDNEGFTAPYDLPNASAYAETCAAIGLVFWAHRMLQVECDHRYADVLERALYNGIISGVSLDGTKFFYVNPLASDGGHHRQEWFGCACCPPNIARLLASLGGYAYSQRDDGLAVHLYMQGEASLTVNGIPLTLAVETRYPWEGLVRLQMGLDTPAECRVRLRIPGWCRQYTLAVNGAPVEAPLEQGYAVLHRHWQPGDVITLDLAMPVERTIAHPSVLEDTGRVALQRGPLVYCLEDVDHEVSVHQLLLPDNAPITARFAAEVLGGVVVLEGEALAPETAAWDGQLYQPLADAPALRRIALRAIPYYAWDNRTPGAMTIWLPRG